MTTDIVIVKKVAFGTKEFMFLRYKINMLIRERTLLNLNYEANALRVNWISNTLRAMADLVYFRPQPKAKPVMNEVADPRPWKKKIKPKKEEQPTLF
jgi:hypothetical protein